MDKQRLNSLFIVAPFGFIKNFNIFMLLKGNNLGWNKFQVIIYLHFNRKNLFSLPQMKEKD